MTAFKAAICGLGWLLAGLSGASTHAADRYPADEQLSIPPDSLPEIVRTIRTVAELGDGAQSMSLGRGFVIGRRYYTVNHNLQTTAPATARRVSYIDGIVVEPALVQQAHDIAVFDLPDTLCRRFCNNYAVGPRTRIEPGQRVVWLGGTGAKMTFEQASVLNLAVIGETVDWSCNANLIVEVDRPFPHGSSGGPVLDERSGRVLGVIQGTLERGEAATGFFKPIDCIDKDS